AGPLDRGLPDYHSAEAYSALVVAAHALEESHRTGASVPAVLEKAHVPTPIGTVQFIEYIDYYHQYPGRTVVCRHGTGEPEVVYPLDRVIEAAEERDAAAHETPAVSPLRLLLDNQMVTLFVTLSLGSLLGMIKVRGISLGMAGIFFVGMPLGYLGCTAPEE